MATASLRWGVLSTAAINNSLIPGLLAAEGSELGGVASRSGEKAAAEAQRWGCVPYRSYEALLDDPSIDVVYNPLPNHLHAEWTIKALEAGKHVLCEKPLALSVAEVDAVAEAAQRSGRLVMEAFMYRHSRRWQRALDLIADGAVGELRLVNLVFAFYHDVDLANIRFQGDIGGGIIWDMGCYAANMARGVVGVEPTEVVGFPEVRAGQETETTFTGAMRFPGPVSAPFSVSFDFRNPFAQVEVVGTEGWLSLPGTGFRREPYTKILHLRGGEVYEGAVEPVTELFPFEDPYRAEVEHLAGAIRGEHSLRWGLDDARANTAVLEAMHVSARTGAAAKVGG
jgi:xylose dehydrogenase (NAD/NADP)